MSRDHSDLAAELVRLERENHQLRCDLAAAVQATREADARARTWRRIAQWIHDATQPDTEETEHGALPSREASADRPRQQ